MYRKYLEKKSVGLGPYLPLVQLYLKYKKVSACVQYLAAPILRKFRQKFFIHSEKVI